MSIIKRIAAVFIGLMLATLLIWIVMMLGEYLFPPSGHYVDLLPEEIRNQAIKDAPVAAHLILVLAFIIGSFVGGLISQLIDNDNKIWPAITTGIILLVIGTRFVLPYPYPNWIVILSLTTFIPFASLGGWLIRSR